jgi:anti-anti-sigma factor
VPLNELTSDIRENYTLLTPFDLSANELEKLHSLVEEVLMIKKQDIVLSLKNIENVYSVHLTAFVQIYKLLKGQNLNFIITDISPAVLNVMQMTQLESLLSLHLSLNDYEDFIRGKSANTSEKELSFFYEIENTSLRPVIRCHGYMIFGTEVIKFKEECDKYESYVLDMTEVGYVDARVLILLSDLADSATIQVRGASSVLLELFEKHRLDQKLRIED